MNLVRNRGTEPVWPGNRYLGLYTPASHCVRQNSFWEIYTNKPRGLRRGSRPKSLEEREASGLQN